MATHTRHHLSQHTTAVTLEIEKILSLDTPYQSKICNKTVYWRQDTVWHTRNIQTFSRTELLVWITDAAAGWDQYSVSLIFSPRLLSKYSHKDTIGLFSFHSTLNILVFSFYQQNKNYFNLQLQHHIFLQKQQGQSIEDWWGAGQAGRQSGRQGGRQVGGQG